MRSKLVYPIAVCAVVGGLLAPAAAWRSATQDRAESAGQASHAGARKVRPRGTVSQAATQSQTVDPRTVRANELGKVPVIMYHRITTKRYDPLDRTRSQLRAELTRLAREGYVPVTAREFVTGNIDIPPGTHPVVLTFDDGHPSHLAFDGSGQPKPDTAMGILLEVASRYPTFRPVATFYVNADPFRMGSRAAQAVQWLVQQGCEVANHAWSHRPLNEMSSRRAEQEIGRTERMVKQLGGGPSLTFALPYGFYPRKQSLGRRGTAAGTTYDFAGVLLAGAMPAPSPFDRSLDRFGIQRIQSNGKVGRCRRWCSEYWLDWLARNPDQRYTADADPMRISFPKAEEYRLAPQLRHFANPY